MRKLSFLLVALVLPLAACIEGGNVAFGPQAVNVSGQWRYDITNLDGGGLTCLVHGVTLNLSQSG